jgi:aromatic ring-cleaving dioxygenase
MIEPLRPVGDIASYHAHIYYDDATRPIAAALRSAIEQTFTVVMGRWRDEPVGPHPQAMYQVAFGASEFARIVPWLMLNRQGLVVLVHPNTGDAVADHDIHPLWLGEKLALRIDFLREFVKANPGVI